jgi:hypothetical protein
MTGKLRDLSDLELDKLLARASTPQLPADFEAGLAKRVAASAVNNVIAFPRRPARPPNRSFRVPLAAALAASLALGLWFGGSAQTSGLLETLTETAMLGAAQDFAPAGMDDLGSLDVDDLS